MINKLIKNPEDLVTTTPPYDVLSFSKRDCKRFMAFCLQSVSKNTSFTYKLSHCR